MSTMAELLRGFIEATVNIFKFMWVKIAGTLGLITFDFFFDVDTEPLLIGLLILILMDFFSAIYASNKNGHKIESRKVAKTAGKTAIYFTLISAGFISEKAVPLDLIDNTIITFLTITELISIMENSAKAGIAIPKGLYKKLKDMIKIKK